MKNLFPNPVLFFMLKIHEIQINILKIQLKLKYLVVGENNKCVLISIEWTFINL